MTTSKRPTWQERMWAIHIGALPKIAGTAEDHHFLAAALCGEAGELVSKIKKIWRRDFGIKLDRPIPTKAEIAAELADVVIYANLFAQSMQIDLEDACNAKADIVEYQHYHNVPGAVEALKRLYKSYKINT